MADLHHVSLEVSDVERTTWFYDRFLGELGMRRFVKESDYVAYTDGALTIWLIKERSPRIHRKPPSGEEEVIAEHLAFHVESPGRVQAIEQKLAQAEIYALFRTEEHPEFRPGYVSCTWCDPDNIVLEVYTTPSAGKKKSKGRSKATPKKRSARKPVRRAH